MNRTQATLDWLRSHPEVFDRITRNQKGGRVSWSQRMPRGYDNKAGLPWSQVRGRYWYPWR